MAKTSGPLLSEAAHGTIGGILTYSKKAIVKQVRFQKKQADVLTAPRVAQRALLTAAVDTWHLLSASEKETWNKSAVGLHMSGYNLYIQEYIKSYVPPAEGLSYYGEALYGKKLYGSQ